MPSLHIEHLPILSLLLITTTNIDDVFITLIFTTDPVFIPTVSTQDGDSAVIGATVYRQPATLRELVRAGSDLNLQNQVRYTVTVDTAPHIIPSCPY